MPLMTVRQQAIYRSGLIRTTPAATVPTYGSELLTDPGLEGTYTGGLNVNLINSGACTVAQSADVHGGSKAQQVQPAGDGSLVIAGQPTLTTGTWYRIAAWTKRTAGAAGNTLMSLGIFNEANILPAITWASYTEKSLVRRSANGAANLPFIRVYGNGGAAKDTAILDDVSIKSVTLSSILSLAGDSGRKNGTYDFVTTVATDTCAGGACCIDDVTNPAYMLYAYIDRSSGNAVLVKRVNGTETKLIDTATGVTYAAGRRLRIVVNGSSIELYYESTANVFTQIGTTQTIDMSSFGTKVAALDPIGSNTVVVIAYA